ncbi:hypothetical protein KY495_22760 [Massilia sp. PAMC28688]|nr:hypothetical protein KY495_22760 [Massilia sp. PAMC28688]
MPKTGQDAAKSTSLINRPDIPGWGSDIDRGKRPAFSMEVEPRDHDHDHGEPQQQRRDMEVLVSNERPKITPLFGTGPAPSGLSGAIRRFAFKFTENDVRHFMLLLLADRVNVVEGIGQDLSKGHVPNVLAEMGIKAEWEHNRAGLVRKVAIAGAVTGLALYLMNRRSRD